MMVLPLPNVEVGEYTYYEDDENPTEFDRKNVLYNHPEFGDKLIIGKFCAIGANTKFIMGAANHSVSTVSTYPFSLFGGKWAKAARSAYDLTPHKVTTFLIKQTAVSSIGKISKGSGRSVLCGPMMLKVLIEIAPRVSAYPFRNTILIIRP